ncbi:hypothetical protein [Streptomyces sp. NPDC058657]|uniref:hypothetical protein n=1 Tax=unclassified Streptomyces TaxID=2593676 RepID=UPI00364E0BAC
MQVVLRGLPVTAQQLREDRILEEAAAVTGARPQHLCAVFNMTPETGLRSIRFFPPDPADSDDGPQSLGDIVTDIPSGSMPCAP